jgi:hypothetical protein
LKLLNDTLFTPREVTRFTFLGYTIDHARRRTTDFYQHPKQPNRVITLRVTHDDRFCVIQDEPKHWYSQPLARFLSGKPHIIAAARPLMKAIGSLTRDVPS